MKRLKLYGFLLLVCLFSATTVSVKADNSNRHEGETTLTADGPYIIYNEDGSARVITVTPKGKIKDKTVADLPADYSFNVVSHDGKHKFRVSLHKFQRPAWQYAQPDRMFVMSDPHGNLDCVVSLLQGNGVIDKKYHWSFGRNKLVVVGDIFDRGNDVMQIYWLLYKLEEEAAEAGGSVDVMLGNHEPMVLMNDLRYTRKKYTMLADMLGIKYPELFGRDSEMGRWISSRNTIIKVGDCLFVHAGLSKQFYDMNMTIPTANAEMAKGLYKRRKERKETSPLVYFLHGSYGPIWYRGMVKDDKKYSPLAADTLQMILDRYAVKRIIVGHTVFSDITTFYGGRVIGVNVDNEENRKAGRGRAILISGNHVFVVGDNGIMREIPPIEN